MYSIHMSLIEFNGSPPYMREHNDGVPREGATSIDAAAAASGQCSGEEASCHIAMRTLPLLTHQRLP